MNATYAQEQARNYEAQQRAIWNAYRWGAVIMDEKPKNHGKFWQRYQDELLRDAWAHGGSLDMIGEVLGRTVVSIAARLRKLELICREQYEEFVTFGFVPSAHFVPTASSGPDSPVVRFEPKDTEEEAFAVLTNVAKTLGKTGSYGVEVHLNGGCVSKEIHREVPFKKIEPKCRKSISIRIETLVPVAASALPRTNEELSRKISRALGCVVRAEQIDAPDYTDDF